MIAIRNRIWCCKFEAHTNSRLLDVTFQSSCNNNNKLLSSLASCSFRAASLSVSNSFLPVARLLRRKTVLAINGVRKINSNSHTSYKTSPHFRDSDNSSLDRLKLNGTSTFQHFTATSKLNYSTKPPGKMAQIISGKEVADEIRANLKSEVEGLKIKPKLAIVQVGGREDSNVYIRMKIQFAESIGASAELFKLGPETSEQELADMVRRLNQDVSIHGIITQLPFDSVNKIDSDKIVNLIDPKKDVDGLCVYNAGKLLHGEISNSCSFVPCTPNGCLELIRKSGIKLEGTRSVVIGRSKIVGSPMAQLLVWHNSTVTICHSRTKNLEETCRQADIIVAAVGKAQMVKKSWIKPGAVVIDCGINVITDTTKKSGTRLVGDVDYEGCKEVAGAITPVPGGVGPMTVAMLISNTVEAAKRVNS